VRASALPEVVVLGLGPSDVTLMTTRATALLDDAPVARLRTRVHPAAARWPQVASYDEWYDESDSFDALYARIVDDLVALAVAHDRVVYAVPGSPIVAERTVELLLAREDVRVVLEPAVSVIDLACAVLHRDPMTAGLRVVDALASSSALSGPGPVLILQAYSGEVLALVSDRLDPEVSVTVLHHLGLDDQVITTVPARRLATFSAADHLTSLWVEEIADAASATRDLVALARRLRAECPWDQEQTHGSLTRHLLEEAYEALDALDALVRAEAGEGDLEAAIAHVEEELGDVWFQVIFHAELGDEAGRFDLRSIAETLRAKLIHRHPHVFGDATAATADEVAARWEILKRDEKGRASVTDGVAWQLPALTLYTKLLRKATQVGLAVDGGERARERARVALGAIAVGGSSVSDARSSALVEAAWQELLDAVVTLAHDTGVDAEGVLRGRAQRLRDDVRAHEAQLEARKVDD
jgi:tetrapyrrole methylase family protein/MazG family protein